MVRQPYHRDRVRRDQPRHPLETRVGTYSVALAFRGWVHLGDLVGEGCGVVVTWVVEVEHWGLPNLVEADPGQEEGAEGSELAEVVLESGEPDCLHAGVEGHAGRDFLRRIRVGVPGVAGVEMRFVLAALFEFLAPDHSPVVMIVQLVVEAAFAASTAQILMVQALHGHFA